MPAELPELIMLGEESEAISYVAAYLADWQQTPGALDWLQSNRT